MKSFFDYTEEEIAKAARLSLKEQAAVTVFIEAAKALPRSICIDVGDKRDSEGHLTVSKRITPGFAQGVASLTKKSLCF